MLFNSIQTQNRRRYIDFENGSHFISNLNLNNLELTIFISFKITNIASGNQEFVNGLIGNKTERLNAKFITFYGTYSSLGLLISKAQVGCYVAIANDGSSSIKPDLKFSSSKSNCTDLNKWHIILVTWSDKGENLSNCWSNGKKLITFPTGNIKGSDYCYIGDLGIMSSLDKTHLTGCIGEIIGFHRSLTDEKILHIHEYLVKKWGITDAIILYCRGISQLYVNACKTLG